MTDQSTVAALLSTARVKFISALVVIALLLGIAAEGISIVTGYYNMQKTKAEAASAGAEAEAATAKFKNPFTAPAAPVHAAPVHKELPAEGTPEREQLEQKWKERYGDKRS